MDKETRTGHAVVFPGMGPTRFEDVARFMVINPQARKLVAAADERLGYSLIDRYRDTEGDYSEYAQIAFLVNSLALAQWAEATLGCEPTVCVGPSFGNKAAAVHSGALDFADGVTMTARFARVLDDYFATEHREAVTLSFARTPPETLRTVRDELDAMGEWHDITCQVDDDFAMLTLSRSRLEWLQLRLRALGGLPLYVMHPPMHSPAFDGLRRRIEDEALAGLEFSDPRLPVISDHDGKLLTTGAEVRELVLDGCVRAVHWPDALTALRDRGVGRLFIAGQDALFGRVSVATRNFEVTAVDPRLALRPQRRGGAR
ncbi:ACP S-malonyltransferase [Streptomyces sp. NBC_00059]|uniref:ACP S-malonyltransferase n=1 Tax=Streptomyces sp. NBC_00059 TaxID=2975635 RepID=UPI00225175C9|nr:ACP S-malonyltransferase [Streptomyces sp. NBC_00059]MCX5414077.1 ACP S-malonyltransferase [Streptomyces sp. NBC_00059]